MNLQNTDMYINGAIFLRKQNSSQLSIEEKALIVKALTYSSRMEDKTHALRAAEQLAMEKTFNPSPIGLYFANLWYSEELYPVIMTADALNSAANLSAGS
jgi:hypothetical protein